MTLRISLLLTFAIAAGLVVHGACAEGGTQARGAQGEGCGPEPTAVLARTVAYGEPLPGALLDPATLDPSLLQCIPADTCCKVCSKGKACGDTCISRQKSCHVGRGCACDAGELCR